MSEAYFETFVDAVASNSASVDDIELWIEKWHIAELDTRDLPKFLGFTDSEYERWLEDPTVLKEIFINHSH